jgi:hypothetical protein
MYQKACTLSPYAAKPNEGKLTYQCPRRTLDDQRYAAMLGKVDYSNRKKT